MLKYCALVPVYNHPNMLGQLVDCLINQHKLFVILVDDGSNISCAKVINELHDRFPLFTTVITHAQNQGKGSALTSGLLKAHSLGFSHALQLDADGQHCWDDIERFLTISTQNPTAIVIGTPIYDASVNKVRLYMRYLTHIWVWINTLSLQIKDSMCGFRVYPVLASINIIQKHSLEPRMGFDTEILVRLHWNRVEIINLPTKVIYLSDGVSHFKVIRDNVGLTKMQTKLFFGMLIRLPKILSAKFTNK